MRRALRWIGIGLGGIVASLLMAALIVFVVSEMALRKEHRAAAEQLTAPTAAQLADAARQARILGCLSCHGDGLKGQLMFEAPGVARVVAPNIPEIAARVSDQQLAAALRQGIGHDGRALFVMPSPMYSHLTDQETAALIAWVRTLPPVEGEPGAAGFGPLGRFAIVTGGFPSAVDGVAGFRREVPIELGPDHAAGRHLVSTSCTECHGPALFGQKMPEGSTTPDLNVVAGYSLDQFKTLLSTGVTPGGNALGLMKEVAQNDFRHMTDAEIAAIHAYLVARARKLGG